MKRLATILAALPIMASGAGFETNWPAWDYPRQGWSHLGQIVTGTTERCNVNGYAAPAALSNQYRDAQSILQDCKDRLEYVLENAGSSGLWVDWREVSGGTANWYRDSTTNLSPNGVPYFPTWSVTGLLAYLELPSNYLDYTPYRALSGSGGFTNDATVGHPHGVTNATTAAAGAVGLPSGRSTWYTTDYGFTGMKLIISNLLWTTKNQSYVISGLNTNYYTESDGDSGNQGTKAGAIQVSNVDYSNNQWRAATLTYTARSSYFTGVGTHRVDQYRARTIPVLRNLSTNGGFHASMDCYLWWYMEGPYVGGALANHVYYDIDGTGRTNDTVYIHESVSEQAPVNITNLNWSIPCTNYVTGGTEAPAAIIVPPADKQYASWIQDDMYVIKWNGTNGFQYK
jgi:hypothetical protein